METADSVELKACPLCGSSCFALIVDERELASCSNEGCVLWANMRPIEEWQSRPLEDKLQAEIERLKDELNEASVASREVTRLVAENERLNKVLDEIAYYVPWTHHTEETRKMAAIARAAREPKGGGTGDY